MRSYILICTLITACSGCSQEYQVGSGPIILSELVENGFDEYNKKREPAYFAVSLNGQSYGYSYCDDQTCRFGSQRVAVQYCQQNSSKLIGCRIFAEGGEIVWDGPVHFRSRGKPNPEIFGDKPFFFGPVYE